MQQLFMVRLAALAGAAAVLGAASVPTFAASPANEPTHGLTITKIVPVSGSNGEYDVTVTGLTGATTKAPGPYYVGFRYNIKSNPKSEGDDSGTQFQQINLESSAPTQTFIVKISTTMTNIDVAEYGKTNEHNGGEHDGNEVRQESPAVPLSNIPYGQAPEVPWAAALPLVALGFGAAVLLRRRLA